MARTRDFGVALTSEQLDEASAVFDLGDDASSGGSIDGARDDAGTVFDPSIHVGLDRRNADGTFTKKRGRKSGPGSGGNSSKREKKTSPSVNTVEQSLIGIHALLAAATKTPELALESDESKPLAIAVSEVAKHYDIPGLDAVTTAWMGLIMVCGKIYVPRAIMIKQRLDQEAKEKRNNVVELKSVQSQPQPQPQKKSTSKSKPQPEIYDPLEPPLNIPL